MCPSSGDIKWLMMMMIVLLGETLKSIRQKLRLRFKISQSNIGSRNNRLNVSRSYIRVPISGGSANTLFFRYIGTLYYN
jgi:hypothetical protein